MIILDSGSVAATPPFHGSELIMLLLGSNGPSLIFVALARQKTRPFAAALHARNLTLWSSHARIVGENWSDHHYAQVVKSVSSSLKYSPTSACRKTTIPVGSSRRASATDRAVTPNPCNRQHLQHTN